MGRAGEVCFEPGKVNAHHTACVPPYSCEAGKICPVGGECTDPNQCQQCYQ